MPVAIEVNEHTFEFKPSPGGLASALSSLNEKFELFWIGWPGEVDLSLIDSDSIKQQLTREYNASPVFLTRRQLNRYYFGFSNRVLWPVLHYRPTHIEYDERDYRVYKEVNQIFADRIVEQLEAGNKDDMVWVHDYQLMLVPAMVREKIPNAKIGFFLHTPFPSSEMFRALPYREELLEGLLGSSVIGFQTHSGLRHFRSSLLHILGLESDINYLELESHEVHIGAYPISIDVDKINKVPDSSGFDEDLHIVRQIKKDRKLILSVDRLDYTKGLPERLSAYKQFLEKNPDLIEKVVLVQVAVPSRTRIPDYRNLKDRVDEIVMEITEQYERLPESPIHFMYRSLPFQRLAAFYKEADVALVTPYFDGMNLVAKEYVAIKKDSGVLILSELAGAASELGEALIINPWNKDQIADAIRQGLETGEEEQNRRMSAMYERVSMNNVHYWANSFLEDLIKEEGSHRSTSPTVALNRDIENSLIEDYRKQKNRVLLLDYDGTLAEIQTLPMKAAPTEELRKLLTSLAQNPSNQVGIVTGRKRNEIENWLGDLPVMISAEHGLWLKEVNSSQWERMASDDPNSPWYKSVEAIFEEFTLRTPGSFVERKDASIAWHYRLSDPTFGGWQAHELAMHLNDILANEPLEVLSGKAVVEVRLQGIHKGTVVNYLHNEGVQMDFLLAAGDDTTDEQLFEAAGEHAWSIKIGAGSTRARYRLKSVPAMRNLLKRLNDQ